MIRLHAIIILLLVATLAYGQCFTDRHSTLLEDAWVSCEMTQSPNSDRDASHWIMYDLGEAHKLGTTHIWNINHPEFTNMGAREIAIDLSRDGQYWQEWGTFELHAADATSYYEGQSGPDLTGNSAQFVLITVLDNFGDNCSGLAEIKIESKGLSTTSNENLTDTESSIQLQPNPAESFTNLVFESQINAPGQLSILDINGRLVQEREVAVIKGTNNIPLNLSGLPSGNYNVRLEMASASFNSQLSIIKN